MLKVINTAHNFGCNYPKSKCAEIHYQSSTFSILCIFCGMKTLAFSEFCEHFNKHYEEFINELPDTEVLTISNESNNATNSNCKHDPLKLEIADLTNDSEVGLNIMRTANQGKITVENKNDESLTGSQLLSQKTLLDAAQNDKDIIIKNRIKVEGTDVSSTNICS